MKIWMLILVLLAGSCALSQESSSIFTGSWTSTAGPTQILRGTWSGETSPKTPNAARGSWTLLNDTGEIQLQGTWSAQKTGQGWQGSWAARTTSGQGLSGAWGCDSANQDAKSFAEMLRNTATKQVAGWWRTGRYQGNWWLKGSPQPVRNP
jgi:hypothetical protein